MVTSCCAYGCTERHQKGSSVTFHRFPKDPLLLEKWIIATKRKGFVPTAASRICGKHFTSADFYTHFGKISLVKNAVPSIFNFPDHLLKKTVPRKCRRQMSVKIETMTEPKAGQSTEIDVCIDVEPVIDKKNEYSNNEVKNVDSRKRNRRQPVYFWDFREEDLNCKAKAKKMWDLSRKIINKNKHTIKYLRNESYRLKKKLKNLSDVINNLKNSKKNSNDCFSILQRLPQPTTLGETIVPKTEPLDEPLIYPIDVYDNDFSTDRDASKASTSYSIASSVGEHSASGERWYHDREPELNPIQKSVYNDEIKSEVVSDVVDDLDQVDVSPMPRQDEMHCLRKSILQIEEQVKLKQLEVLQQQLEHDKRLFDINFQIKEKELEAKIIDLENKKRCIE